MFIWPFHPSDTEQHSSHLLRGGSLKSLTLTDIITSRILTSSPESPCIIVRFYEIVLTCCRSAFASWLLMNLLLVVVPRYGAYAMMVTGTLLHCTALVYYMLIPFNPLVVRFEGGALLFRLGWCFWLVIAAGEFCKPHLASGHANYACLCLLWENGLTNKTGNVRIQQSWGVFVQTSLLGKTISITYSECVFVASVIQHAERSRFILSSVACVTTIFFSSNYFISGTIFGGWGITEHKMCVLIFSTTFVWNVSHSK